MTTLHPRSAAGAGARSRRISAVQTHSILRSMIRHGSLATGEILHEDDLGQALGASRRATRDALQSLAQERLITRRPRAGTVVTGVVAPVPIDQIVAHVDSPERYTLTLLASQVIDGEHFGSRLPTETGLHRVREWLISQDGAPVCVLTAIMAEGPTVHRAIERAKDVAETFRHVHGVELGTIESAIEAVALDARLGQLLGAEAGTPALVREQVLRDVDGAAREMNYTLYRGDGFAMTTTHLV